MRRLRRHPLFALAIAASLALTSCTSGADKVPTPVHELVAVPPAPDPKCEIAAAERVRVPALLAAGRLGRTVRVIERADALCPKSAPNTWGALVTALAELGRDEEARQLARVIEASPVADGPSREAAKQARTAMSARAGKAPPDEAASARAFASAAQARAKGQLAEAKRGFLEAWSLHHPNGAALVWAGMATKELGDAVEAQRLFDRALVQLEGSTGVDAEPSEDEEALPWGRPRSPGGRKPDKHEKDPNGVDWDLFGLSLEACDPICRDAEDRAGDRARPRPPTVVVQVPRTAAAEGLAWSPDGRWLAVVEGRAVSIRDQLLDGRETLRLEGHTKDITSVAVSPDGGTLVTSSWDKTIRLWSLGTGGELQRLRGHEASVDSVGFSADGATIVSGSSDRSARFWSAATGEETRRLDAALEDVLSVAISPDGKTVAFALADDTVRLWSVEAGKELRKLVGHDASVHRLAFSPDGRVLATSSADGKVLLWSVPTGALTRRVAHPGKPASEPSAPPVAFSPDGRTLAIGGPVSFLVAVAAGGSPPELEGPGDVLSFAFSPDGKSLTSGAFDGSLRTYEVPTRAPSPGSKVPLAPTNVRGGRGPAELALSVAWAPDGRTLAAGSWDRSVRLFRSGSRGETRVLRGHTDAVLALAFSPSGQTLASGSRDRTLRLFDVATGAETRKLEGHGGPVWSVAFSPDGQTLASGSKDATARLWSVASGSETRKLEGHKSSVTSVAFSPDGQTVASAAEDRSIRLWSTTSVAAPRKLEGHARDVTDLAFSPDGSLLASASKDRTVRLWAVAGGTELRKLELKGNDQEVLSVAFSPDGKTLAWGMADETVGLAPVASLGAAPTPARLEAPSGHASPVAFAPGGKVIAARSHEALVLWTAEGRPLVTVGAVAASDAGFALGPGAAPLVEVLGPDFAAGGAFPVCRSGAQVFPFDLCRERFEVQGMLARAFGGEATIDEP